jgi:hypothetical protein
MAGLANQIFFPKSKSSFKADFSEFKFRAFSSPKHSPKISPGNGLKIRPAGYFEKSCVLRKPHGLCEEWAPLKSGLFYEFSLGQ